MPPSDALFRLTYQKLSKRQEKSEPFAIFGVVISSDMNNQLLYEGL